MIKKILEKKVVILEFLLFLVLVAFDLFTKRLAIQGLQQGDRTLISGVLSLHLLENDGMAFSLMKGKTLLFYIITPLLVILILSVYMRLPKNRRFLPLQLCLTVLLSGAIGNFIDRLAKKTVTDFIYFSLIDFPVFNVADIYVVLSMAGIILLLLFYYKGDELDFLE